MHFAHYGSNSDVDHGAVTSYGVTERDIQQNVYDGMCSVDTLNVIPCKLHIKAWKQIGKLAQDENCKIAVSPHFNASKFEKKTEYLGHMAISSSHPNAVGIGNLVLENLGKLMCWSRNKGLIIIPDKRFPLDGWPNNLKFPRVTAPNLLVEAGFNYDYFFGQWIHHEQNQFAYGVAIADAIDRYYKDVVEE